MAEDPGNNHLDVHAALINWAPVVGLILMAVGIVVGFYLPTVAARWSGPETLDQESPLQVRSAIGALLVLIGTGLQIYGALPRWRRRTLEHIGHTFELVGGHIDQLASTSSHVHVDNVGWMSAQQVISTVLIAHIADSTRNPDATIADLKDRARAIAEASLKFPQNDPESQKAFLDAAKRQIDQFFDGFSMPAGKRH